MINLERIRQDIDKALEDASQQDPRDYLGISSIGGECWRKIWYSYRFPLEKIRMDAKSIRRINDGHEGEAKMRDILNALPYVTVEESQKTIGNHFIKGHVDGIIHITEEDVTHTFVWEHKQTNENSFKTLARKLLQEKGKELLEWNATYYAQAQLYMHFTNIKQHYLTVGTPGLTDYIQVITAYCEEFAKACLSKAEDIMNMSFAPGKVSHDPAFYLCGWCSYKDVCHGDKELNRHCRTCKFVDSRNANWTCGRSEKALTAEEQKLTCEEYEVVR